MQYLCLNSIKKGIHVLGALINFGTEINQFEKLFPQIEPHLLTVNLFYYVPVLREILLALGCSAASKENIENILENRGKCEKKGQVKKIINNCSQRFINLE